MILGDSPPTPLAGLGDFARATLDDMFRRGARLRPDAVALADPPNREAFAKGPPRRLTYAEADRTISAIATRLRQIGLQTDQIVAVHLPNTIEQVLTLLGVLRAGLIAAPLPLLWREADAVAALTRISPAALITAGRVGDIDYCELAMKIAAKLFTVRHVGAFGHDASDGFISFDDVFDAMSSGAPPAIERGGNAASHVAVVTWDVSPDGPVPVARNHFELLSAGIAVVLESRIEKNAAILSAMAPTSFAGIALTLLPWLVSAGSLHLHHPFDADVFSRQCEDERCETVIVPARLAPRLAELFSDATRTVIAAWRTPERLADSPPWPDAERKFIDVQIFGEIGLVPALRDADGQPVPIPPGAVKSPMGAARTLHVAEIARTEANTLAMRGPMVPRFPFPPGSAERFDASLKVGSDGFVDTGFTCRIDRVPPALVVTGSPPGIVAIGGYRFATRELQDAAAIAEPDSTLTALPDSLTGHRLGGSARDRDRARGELARLGANPLILGAYRERPIPGRRAAG